MQTTGPSITGLSSSDTFIIVIKVIELYKTQKYEHNWPYNALIPYFVPGYESASGLSMSPSAPPWQGRSIASSKLRMLEFSAFLEQPQDPENVSP